MLASAPAARGRPLEISKTRWVRARRSGITRVVAGLGDRVAAGDPIAEIGDVLGGRPTTARAPADGIVIGLSRSPLVNRGDAIANLGLL